ncbi:Amidohydrolase [Verrucomicrobia bacterium]|nr:Amidohydrolase [Verrucomicrobiota bacterium]
MRFLSVLLLAGSLPVAGQSVPDLAGLVDAQLPGLVATYKDLHLHPELSHYEVHTSAFLAAELRKAGYEVTERVGKYPDDSQAYGIVGALKNGAGRTVLVRTDLDGLPIEEQTGLPYASHDRGQTLDGNNAPAMHACGHDIHITSLLGAARVLAQLKDQWHGTLILVGQPSEETIDGARAMIADHLYERFGRPDYVLGQHDDPLIPAGTAGIVSGATLASSTSVDVTLRGVGGHGARPEVTKDPIVMAAEYILEIQTIVSRQIAPQEPAVVTVGTIRGGTKRNIIPDEVKLELTTRAYSDAVRDKIVDSLQKMALGVATANGLPPDRMPIVTVSKTEVTPVTYNDLALAARLKPVFVAALGAGSVVDWHAEMGSEDFGLFGLPDSPNRIPAFFLRIGATDPGKLADSQRSGIPVPGLHSALFAPVASPTIRTGVLAMSAAVLELMKK